MKKVTVNVTWDEIYGAWLASLSNCVAVADTLSQLKNDIATSIEVHLKTMREDGDAIPSEFQEEYELDFKLNAQALLHSCCDIVTQKALAEAAGISSKQMKHYYTGFHRPHSQQRAKIISGLHKLGHELLSVE
jgi:predicted RNase H-like HicB family nuclease